MPACEATRPYRDRTGGPRLDSAVLHARLGAEQTDKYMDTLRDTMKGLVRSTVVMRARDDLRPGILMATSDRHCIFFETDSSVLVTRVLHDRMDYRRHLRAAEAPHDEP